MWVLIVVLVLGNGALVALAIYNRKKYIEYQCKYNALDDLYHAVMYERSSYKIKMEEYKREVEKRRYESTRKIDVTQEVREAVRFAVIKSHPDNGGDKDDFIRYNELYKKLKKGE